jgi:Fungal N-terminal domain of STAND proteins
MSGFEAAGALLGLVSLISKILEPIQELQYGLKALKSLQIELSALFEVLNALRPLVEYPSGKKISIPQDLFVSCRDTLTEIQKIIDVVASKSAPRYVSLAVRFKHQQRFKQLKEDLDRHKATFSIVLTSIARRVPTVCKLKPLD